jgi:hypothetical protein
METDLNKLRDRAYKNACEHGFHDEEKSDAPELWADIEGYEGSYQVSNMGRVKSLDRLVNNKSSSYTRKGNIKSPKNSGSGYLQVSLCKNGIVKNFLIHRLVAKAFIKNPYAKGTVNHLNCNTRDNRSSNLEWATLSENIKYAFKKGKKPTRYWSGKTGINSSRGTHIFQLDKLNHNIVNEFGSAMEAYRITGINDRDISSCIRGKLKSAGGYLWKNGK